MKKFWSIFGPHISWMWPIPAQFWSISGYILSTSGPKKWPRIFLWYLEANHPIATGRIREKLEKCYSENAQTLSARFWAKSKNPPVDLTYVKIHVISSWNQLKNQKFHAGEAQTSSLKLGVLGVKMGVMPPPASPCGGWRVNSP